MNDRDPASFSLYGAIGEGEDGRVVPLSYPSEGCWFPALCVSGNDKDATAQFRRLLKGHSGQWAIVKYPRDSSEHFVGEDGYEVVASCPRSIEQFKLLEVLRAFWAKVDERMGEVDG